MKGININRQSVILAVFVFFLSNGLVHGQLMSLQYDFEPFGDTTELKPIGGLAPLPTGILCADWLAGTPLWQGLPGSTISTTTSDRYSYPIDLGFTFNFYNSRYSIMKASDNYFISFDMTHQDTSSGTNTRILDSNTPWDAIFLFWDNGRIYTGSRILNQISYSVLGSEIGHRNFILEFFSVGRYNSPEGPNYLTGWISLYESTNTIELWYFKTQSSTCYQCGSGTSYCGLEYTPCAGDDCCDADIGMEYSAGNNNADTIGDEPFSLSPYNNDSWHNGCSLPALIDNCIPNFHYRFKPVSYSWDSMYWPEDFNGLTDFPDWWSLVDEPPRNTGWKYSATGYGAPGGFSDGCVYTDSGSTEEILVTRFVNFAGESLPGFQMNHKFLNNGGNNKAEILLSLDGNPWTSLWSMQGSSTSDVETLAFAIPAAANQPYTQLGFRYTRTDLPTPIFTENMSGSTAPAGWTHAGANDRWQYNTIPMATPINWSTGYGPHNGVEGTGSYFYGTNIYTTGNGYYLNSSNNYLRSPTFSCTGYNYVEARFFQWLGLERSPNDVASFQLTTNGGTNWQTVWTSSSLPHWLGDTSWVEKRFDISAFAANQANVSLRWLLVTNGSVQSFGWNVDNVSVVGRPSNTGYWAIDDVIFQREPTPTPTITPTETPTNTPTETPTPTSTPSPTNTPTETPTGAPSLTPTPSPTNTSYYTPTFTPSRTPTNTPSNTPTPTAPTQTPTSIAQLNCTTATELLCNELVYVEPSVVGTNLVETYSCLPSWVMTGHETVFKFLCPETTTYTALINSSGSMILLSLESCSEFSEDCSAGTFAVSFDGTMGETKYFVVDSIVEFESNFSIQIRCSGFEQVPSTSHHGLLALMIVFGVLLTALPFRKR